MPSRLLDVGGLESQEVKLVLSDTREAQPYAALSHCWGQSRPFRTTKATISRHLEGILVSSLPQTFKDAVLVTRMLGIRYLWVDSLCIVQDDKADWFHEAATMASVYSNAEITIMASRASSSDQSFLTPRVQTCIFKEEVDNAGKKTSFRLINGEIYHNSMARDTHINSNPLFKRAWVVQERILSRKKLMFCGDQAFWECNQLEASEDSQIYQNKEEHSRPKLSDWYEAVEAYMACDITYEEDVLPAMAGIARSTAQSTGFSYCAGIWLEKLPNSLLWYPGRDAKKERRETYVAPSFSWAASRGPIWYRATSVSLTGSGFCKYITCQQERPDGSDDPYGALTSAAIVLQGPTLKATRLAKDEWGQYLIVKLQNGHKYSIPVAFDHEDTLYDINRMFVLPLYDDETRMQALVLLRVSDDLIGAMYQRIGISYCRFSDVYKVDWWGSLTKTDFSEDEWKRKGFILNMKDQKDTIILI
jgi:hypothetical protein